MSLIASATFVIDGSPFPKGHAYRPDRSAGYERHVHDELWTQTREKHLGWPMDAGSYAVRLDIFSRNPLFPDARDIARAVVDGAVWALWDDAIKVEIAHAQNHHDPQRPRVELHVEAFR